MPLAPADAPETVARVREGMPVVDVIAHQLYRELGAFDLDDLRSAGHEGLLQAARSFDPSLGVPFRRWVSLRVRGAMIDSLRNVDLPRHIQVRIRAIEAGDRMSEAAAEEEAQNPTTSAADADARLSSYLAGMATAIATGLLATPVKGAGPGSADAVDPSEAPDDRAAREQLLAMLREAVALQPDAERQLLTRHYFEGVTFEKAAKEMGLSKAWASRLHARAIEGITRELKRRRVLR
jgi:RNA polymerase sigma factor for flagellar operon FliA